MNLPVDYVQLLAEVKGRIQTAQLRAAFAANSELMLAFFWAYVEEPVFVAKVPDEKVPQPVAQMADPAEMPQLVAPKEGNTQLLFLPWGHHVMLLEKVKPLEQRLWYVAQSLVHGWSRNVLQAQIASGAYHRQGQALTNFFSRLPAPQSDLAQQTLKDPYVFDFLTIEASFHERELETGLIKHLEAFLLELGQGFAFVGRQYSLNVGESDFYIDLLFYHLKLRSYVAIELKRGEFKPEYAGKLNFYCNVVDDTLRHASDAPTIGLLLCQNEDSVLADYALRGIDKPIGIANYELTRALPASLQSVLPSIEALEAELNPR
jgi:predicted nuclease of restriction endonuclease-like (RecB) superfamily